MNALQVPALDYEHANDFFYKKLADNRHGRGRMESAFYHTAMWIFQQGIAGQAELVARIAELESRAGILRAALEVHGQEAAQLVEQRDELLAICRSVIEHGIGGKDIRAMEAAIAKAEASHA